MKFEHVVRTPRAPFTSANGAITVHQIPAWKDNLIWVLACNETGDAAVVDGPEAGAVLECCETNGLRLTTVLNTHTHGDHVGINKDLDRRGLLSEMTVYGRDRRAGSVPGLTHAVDDGDTVRFGAVAGHVWLTEGHLNGHVSFVFDDLLFCGDTMFGAGCGYLFDGPPAKMKASLDRIATLPAQTRVCCAHEYTEDNLRFAWSVEPDNDALAIRIRRTWALRSRGECSVPSTIEDERATNPFLRHESHSLREAVRAHITPTDDTAAAWFAATRQLKDQKHYKSMTDADLPLGGGPTA